ncbi:MAG: FAD-dependent oxidoreductase, partial [Verrucomicrobiota bacterium]
MKERFDFLIAGAGFSGLTVAQQLAERTGSRCLVVDRRDHLGGNSYDHHDAAGVLIHPYGPHYFRSNSRDVVAYLSRFTGWHEVKYRVLSYTDDRYWSFPVNLLTFEQLMGREATEEEFVHWLSEQRVPIDAPANSEEQVLSMVGRELYEKFYRGYTLKQWQRDPKELDASVCARIPVRTNRDDRYLAESFQALPRDGYTALFRKMLESVDPLVEVRLGTDYREVT